MTGMFSRTVLLLPRGHYKLRLKTRMVGYVPKVNIRKVKGMFVTFRSEANTGKVKPHIKPTEERLENAGKKIARVDYDDTVGRYTVWREAKLSGAFITKGNIAAKPQWPLPSK